MSIDYRAEYSERSDDELLKIASARGSLMREASAALDDELRRRNLTESDRIDHQRFVKRQEQRESRRHRRKPLGPFKNQMGWRDWIWILSIIAAILFTYFALPARFRLKPDWADPAFIVMLVTVVIGVIGKDEFRQKTVFWLSLAVSSSMLLALLHAWAKRTPNFINRGGKAAAMLGFVLFLIVYGFANSLRRNFYGNDHPTTSGPP